jgi:PAS domain S-box-containing protein
VSRCEELAVLTPMAYETPPRSVSRLRLKPANQSMIPPNSTHQGSTPEYEPPQLSDKAISEKASRESEERFQALANTAPVMIWLSGTDKLCSYVNQNWLQFRGRSLQQELGDGWSKGIHPEDEKKVLEAYIRSFDRRKEFRMEYRLRRHDGVYRWILDNGVPRHNVDGSFAGYIGFCIDVTDNKEAERALSNLSQRLIEAHEEERARIARELHDNVNQQMALLATNLEDLMQNPPTSSASLARQLAQTKQRAVQVSSEIQALCHRLHPSRLQLLGLAAAAKSFCKEVSHRRDVTVDFHAESVPRNLSPEVSLCLFRVVQESVQNAIKHSGSGEIRVRLGAREDAIELHVSDSGNGFSPEEATRGSGLGLTSMKERLKLVHGDLSIESKPKHGTTVRARVPISQKAFRSVKHAVA